MASFTRGRGSAALRIGRHSLAGQVYLVTFSTRARRRLFLEHELAVVAAGALRAAATARDTRLIAWVLMPEHCHLLVELGRSETLSRWVGRVKAAMARGMHACDPQLGPVWSRGFHDHALRNDESVRDAAAYVLMNPVRAKLALRIRDYRFWGANWLPEEEASPL